MTRQLAAGLLCFLYASGVAAQTGSPVTDVARLEGTWTLDIERSGVTESERRVVTLGPTWIRVTIHRAMDDHPPVLIYNLDGSKASIHSATEPPPRRCIGNQRVSARRRSTPYTTDPPRSRKSSASTRPATNWLSKPRSESSTAIKASRQRSTAFRRTCRSRR